MVEETVLSPRDPGYFVAWLERTIADVAARDDFNTAREKEATLAYLRSARLRFEEAM